MNAEPEKSQRSTTGYGPGLIALLGAMHLILLYNAIRHNPYIGYDGREHIAYIQAFAKGHLPTPNETREFFSPPLPYVIPAALLAVGAGEYKALKIAQLSQVGLSILLVIYLLRICDMVRPGCTRLKLMTMGLLAMLPVYYKTFAMIRGEPWVVCLSVMAAYYALRSFSPSPGSPGEGGGEGDFELREPVQARNHPRPLPACRERRPRAIALGIACGLLLLSRQWGFAVVAAIAVVYGMLLIRNPEIRSVLLRQVLIATSITIAISAGYYIHLQRSYGSILAFNRPISGSVVPRQPQHIDVPGLFTDPIKDHFTGQAIPIFYSELWGDYWCFFLVWGRENGSHDYIRSPQLTAKLNTPGFQTNRFAIAPYLGRVNLFSLLPTTLLIMALSYGIARFALWLLDAGPTRSQTILALSGAIVLASLSVYIVFLLKTPSPNFDTSKATYVLQIFPFLSLPAAELLVRMIDKRGKMYAVIWCALLLVAIHNVPACITRFTR